MCVTALLLSVCAAASKTVSFYNKDERGEIQRVTFDSGPVKRIFHGSFHKVKSCRMFRGGGACWQLCRSLNV